MGSLSLRAAGAVLGLSLAAVVGAPAGPALAGDIVEYTDGKTGGNSRAALPPKGDDFAGSNWEVVDWGVEKVTYRIEGVPQIQSVDASKIKNVYFDPANVPQALSRGRSLADAGNWAEARETLDHVSKDSSAPAWARAEAAYVAAQTYASDGDTSGAVDALGAFKEAFKDSKWIVEATETRANLLLKLGKVDDARKEFASLKNFVGAGDNALQVEYYLIWLDEKVAAKAKDQAGIQKAKSAYEALLTKLSGKSAMDVLSRRCQVGIASCMIELGQHAEAKALLEKMIKDANDQRVLAAAYNMLGTATWRAAPSKKDEMRQALYHYLRVVCLYGDAAGTEDDCAEAMFHAGELFRELRDQGQDWMARARREWTEVKARFPGTVWAQKAEQALVGR